MRNLFFVALFAISLGALANTAPVANDDSYTTDWDSTLQVAAPGLLGNDEDIDGDDLETHLFEGPERGYLSLFRDGSFDYTPELGYAGTVSFVYKAWDGRTFTTATATITITSGNEAPIAGDDTYTLESSGRFYVDAPGVMANDSDPDGDPLETHLFEGPEQGTLGFHHDGSFWYDPVEGWEGEVTFVYKVTDGPNRTYATVTLIIQDPQETCAKVAHRDRWGKGKAGHAFWLPGIGTDFVFEADGDFVEHGNTATLTGTIRRKKKRDEAFIVEVVFSGYTESAPPGSPKKELRRHAYAEHGGPVDTDTWYYYTNLQGSLTGIRKFEGAVIDLSRRGPAFQVGEGANGKNIKFGGSCWLNWDVLHQGDHHRFGKRHGTGDININICD